MGKNCMSGWPSFLIPASSTKLSRNTVCFVDVKRVCRRTDRFGLSIVLSFYASCVNNIKYAWKHRKSESLRFIVFYLTSLNVEP
jgi:hypothetical protein